VNESNPAIQIEHQCPQCGGPVILEETDHFLSCSYCRVNLYMMADDFHRYYFPPSTYPVEECLFVPYWRFRGMHFSVIPYNVHYAFLDTNFLSAEQRFLPVSMGYRAQALKMKFFSSKIKTCFLEASLNFKDVPSIMLNTSKKEQNLHYFHNVFIGETVSMIYAPVYLKNNLLYDGILDRAFCEIPEQALNKLTGIPAKKIRDIKFISALCPDCGADLAGSRSSIVLICRNCTTAWQPAGCSMEKVEFYSIPSKEENVINLPFWKMDVDVQGFKFGSYADLVRAANLPKAITPVMEGNKLYFYSPAFNANPKTFLRLCRQFTMIQPAEALKEEFPETDLCPVTVNNKDALETIKVTLAHMTVLKRNLFPLLTDIKIIPEKSVLVYIPFKIRGSELIHDKYKFGIQRNAIRNY